MIKLITMAVQYTKDSPAIWFTLARNDITKQFSAEQAVRAFEALEQIGF